MNEMRNKDSKGRTVIWKLLTGKYAAVINEEERQEKTDKQMKIIE